MDGKVHGVAGAFEERGCFLTSLKRKRGVEHANAIEFRPLVILRCEMRMALDDQQPPLGVEIARDWMHDIGRRREQLDNEARIGGFGYILLPQRSRSEENANGDTVD